MKKFQFKLTTLLNFREQEEQFAQKELNLVQQQLNQLFDEVHRVQEERHEVEATLAKVKGEATQIHQLTEYIDYLESLSHKIANIQDQIIKTQNILAHKRQKLLVAKKNKEVLEKLKENHFTQWQKEQDKIEAEVLDELATTRHQPQQRH